MALEITADNIDDVTASGVALLDFYTNWCGPCRLIAPIINQLATQYEGRAVIGKVDADAQQQIALKYEVMAYPTVIVVKDGEVKERLVGRQVNKPGMTKVLEELLEADSSPAQTADADPIAVTPDNVESVLGSGVVLLDFYTDMCGPCKMLAPVISQLAKDFAGRAKIAKLNAGEHTELSANFEVMSVPVIILFKDGEQVDRMQGVGPHTSLESLTATLNGLLDGSTTQGLDWF